MNVRTENIAADAPVLLREREKDVAILVLNRPDVRNSLSEAMLIALSSALGDIAADNTVRAVVLAANGSAFCAGHDLKELTSRRSDADGGRAYFHRLMTTCSDMMQQIVHLPRPIIAAVQGVATAAGCQLVASCASRWPIRHRHGMAGDHRGCDHGGAGITRRYHRGPAITGRTEPAGCFARPRNRGQVTQIGPPNKSPGRNEK